MNKQDPKKQIQRAFEAQVNKDKRIRNAYLLVHSDKHDLHLNIACGSTNGIKADPRQCIHLASVGKLFTATLIGMLYDDNKLDYDDPIAKHLDPVIMHQLHVFKGKDYSHAITIRHLLMQSSGLNDVFFHLVKLMTQNTDFQPETLEAIQWGKKHLKPLAIPGQKHFYTDTNYYLLGMIIQSICGKEFYEVMHEYIFEPLKMDHAFMHGFTKPKLSTDLPDAHLFWKNYEFRSIKGIHWIDHAGGSVIAPLDEYLIFFQALIQGRLIQKQTLQRMISDDINMGFPTLGFRYGYSIWKFKTIPVLMPPAYYSWGCVGVTGAFMFYHPKTESIIIGSFNDYRYRGKALEFMARKVIKNLLKLEE